MTDAKDVLEKVAIEVMTEVSDKALTGAQKEKEVCEFLAKLDDNIPIADFIPNELEAEILDTGIDKLQEIVKEIDLPSFVKSCYGKIKTLLNKLFHKA